MHGHFCQIARAGGLPHCLATPPRHIMVCLCLRRPCLQHVDNSGSVIDMEETSDVLLVSPATSGISGAGFSATESRQAQFRRGLGQPGRAVCPGNAGIEGGPPPGGDRPSGPGHRPQTRSEPTTITASARRTAAWATRPGGRLLPDRAAAAARLRRGAQRPGPSAGRDGRPRSGDRETFSRRRGSIPATRRPTSTWETLTGNG